MRLVNRVRLCRLSFAFGVSIIAIGASSYPAFAQCTPDPTVSGDTTICMGDDPDGLVVKTNNTTLVVDDTARVFSGVADAGITFSNSNSALLSIAGSVQGGGKPGLLVRPGPPSLVPCDPYAGASIGDCASGQPVLAPSIVSVQINVAANALVNGSNALLISDPSNTGSVTISLSNAGTMTGLAGPAVTGTAAGVGFYSIYNLSSGFIGGIAGPVTYLQNAGTIDGGGNAAFAANRYTTVSNTGRIVSLGPDATVSANGDLFVTNKAGGTIGGGAVALRNGNGRLQLTNEGTIDGSVVSTAAAGQNSVIDTADGSIDGDLTLGAGDDTLRARYDPSTGNIASVTGKVDGGAGIDTVDITVDQDSTLASAVLPTNFERLGVELQNAATLTLAPGYAGAVQVSGAGSLVNHADLMTSGVAISATRTGYPLNVTNNAAITATLGGNDQFAISTPTLFTNNGTLTANGGGGVHASNVVNDGGIVASGAGAQTDYGTLSNAGTIVSTGSVGAQINGNFSDPSINTGTITGATTGVFLADGRLENAGTIGGGITGVELGSTATLFNDAGAVITGGSAGVTNSGFSEKVVNAGTIKGDVNLVSTPGYDFSDDVFVDAGGTVNGAIRLGGGDDQLVVNLAADPARPLAGATGGVDAGDGFDTLRYFVNADASVTLAPVAGFEGLAFELDHQPALTLSALTPFTNTVGLTGNGTVMIDGTIATTDQATIDATIPALGQLAYGVSVSSRR